MEQKNKLEDDLKNSRRNKIRVENALEQEKAKYKTQEKSFQGFLHNLYTSDVFKIFNNRCKYVCLA